MDESRPDPLPASPSAISSAPDSKALADSWPASQPAVSSPSVIEDFRAPGPSRLADALMAAALAVVHGLAWAPFFITLLIYVPRYEKTFADFAMRLPWLTESVIDLSDMLLFYFPLVLVMLPLCLALDGLALYGLRRWSRPLSWAWFVLLLLAGIMAFAIVRLAMMLAMIELMEGLSK
jgi:hypothetical protein